MPSGTGPEEHPTPPTYSSGERVFAPPLGVFDVEWVAREVERRTGTSFDVAHAGTAAAWRAARTAGALDVGTLTAAAEDVGVPPEAAGTLARCVQAYCDAYDVDPADR
jgi:hypothetical protein